MTTLTPVTKCPKCGGTTIDATAFMKSNPDDLLTCPRCGHQAAKSKFLADLVEQSAKMLQDTLKNIPGFKPK